MIKLSILFTWPILLAPLHAVADNQLPGNAQSLPTVAEVNSAIDAYNRENCKKPQYPEESKQKGEHGTVLMGFLVGPDGAIQESKIVMSSGSPRLDQAALTAFAKCRLHPTAVDGKIPPEPKWAQVKYTWVFP